jgi:hypothetical protein
MCGLKRLALRADCPRTISYFWFVSSGLTVTASVMHTARSPRQSMTTENGPFGETDLAELYRRAVACASQAVTSDES